METASGAHVLTAGAVKQRDGGPPCIFIYKHTKQYHLHNHSTLNTSVAWFAYRNHIITTNTHHHTVNTKLTFNQTIKTLSPQLSNVDNKIKVCCLIVFISRLIGLIGFIMLLIGFIMALICFIMVLIGFIIALICFIMFFPKPQTLSPRP